MTKVKQAVASAGAAPQSSAYDRIISAAYACFGRVGIERTTIEDIAQEAGVSRPTVYRYFPGKRHIVDFICAQESIKVNAEVRRRLVRDRPFPDLVTEALLLIVRIASKNPYVRRILAYSDFQARAQAHTSMVHHMHREWWGRLLQHATERGELAADLDEDEILTWITSTEHMLLVRVEGGPISDAELRRMIRRFVVEPLLAFQLRAGAPPPAKP